jgi:single-stranded DNA-binding protein
MSDVNKTTHVGTAVTNPSFINISSSTPVVVFTMKVRETWKNRKGEKQHKDNLFKVEVLGKNAFWVKENVRLGRRYHIDGYLRSDPINGVEEVRIRAFNVQEEDDGVFTDGYKEGLNRAVSIVENSDDLEAARLKINLLITGE